MSNSFQLKTVQSKTNDIYLPRKTVKIRDTILLTEKLQKSTNLKIESKNTPNQAYYSLLLQNPGSIRI